MLHNDLTTRLLVEDRQRDLRQQGLRQRMKPRRQPPPPKRRWSPSGRR